MSRQLDEGRLHEELVRIASRVAAPEDARERIQRRVERRRRSRRVVRGTVAALVLLASATTAAALQRTDDDQITTTAQPVPGGAPALPFDTGRPLSLDEPLPRLVIDHPDYPPVSADIRDEDLDTSGPRISDTVKHVQSFRVDPQRWDPPMILLRTAIGSTFGYGQLSPGAATLDVNGSTGYLTELGPGFLTLGWRRPDGIIAHVTAVGLDADEIISFGRNLTLRHDGNGWETDHLPAGLQPAFDGAYRDPARWRSQEVWYRSLNAPVSLSTRAATPSQVEERIVDHLDSEDITTIDVRGRPGALIHTATGTVVVWPGHAGTVLHELRIPPPTDASEVDTVLRAITEVSATTWRERIQPLDQE